MPRFQLIYRILHKSTAEYRVLKTEPIFHCATTIPVKLEISKVTSVIFIFHTLAVIMYVAKLGLRKQGTAKSQLQTSKLSHMIFMFMAINQATDNNNGYI